MPILRAQNRFIKNKREERKVCYFCQNNIKEIDYKDIELLRRLLSISVKILPRRRSGACAKHQRKLALAIKRARFMALLPFVRK